MKRLFIYLWSVVLCTLSIFGQERLDSVGAVVVDADTGEPVPYVSVYVSPSCGTISNYDGEFSLECLPSDVLRISCIGYEKVSRKASELFRKAQAQAEPDTIRMKPLASTLRELTVVGTDDLLGRLVRKMQKEARKNVKAEGRYFFRLSTRYPGTDELAEAFLTAKSCVQMRDIHFHSGIRGLLSEGKIDNPDLKGLGRTNLHVFLRLAPILLFEDAWDFAIVPSDIVLSRKGKLLSVTSTSFTDDDGSEICKMNFTAETDNPSFTILEGIMYVDRKKCQLLRFDGEVKGLHIRFYDHARQRSSIEMVGCTLHVDYRHDHGFTEIANMSGTILRDNVMVRYILFNLGEKEVTFNRTVYSGNDMIETIDKVGFDSTLWAMTGIVKRTQAEERVAFGDSAFFSPFRKNREVTTTEQERSANHYLKDAIRQLKKDVMPLHHGLPQ